jgi:hypothetical protein
VSAGEVASLLLTIIGMITGAAVYFGSLRVRLATLEEARTKLDAARESLKEMLARHDTAIQLLQQDASSRNEGVERLRREFKADTQAQNGILRDLPMELARAISGRLTNPPALPPRRDARVEPESTPPSGQRFPPRRT